MLKTLQALFFFVFLLTTAKAQTTQDEYNYVTKGYKIELENAQNGLSGKRGYNWQDLGDWGMNQAGAARNCNFKALYRDGDNKPCAVMMVFKRTDIANGAVFYICIPSPDAPQTMWVETYNFINSNLNNNNDALQAMIWALMKLSAQESMKAPQVIYQYYNNTNPAPDQPIREHKN